MFLRTTSSAIAVIALTAPAFAEVTPAEVWQNWVDYYKANGYTVTEGSRDEAGETLALKDVVVAFAAPDDEGGIQFTMPEITLTATGDGKVRTVVSETSPVKASFKNEDGEKVELDASVTIKDAEIVSSGGAADMTHDSKASEVVVAVQNVTTPEGQKSLPLNITMTNLTSSQHYVDGGLAKVDVTMAADRVALDGTFEGLDKEDPAAKATVTGGFDGLNGSGTVALPKGADPAKDMNAAFKAGMAFAGTFSAGAGKFDMQFASTGDDGQVKSGSATSELKGFELTADMSAAGLKYQGSSDATTTSITAAELPVPLKYAVEGATFDLQMPVMKADAPAPFKIAYSLSGLTVGDEIWGLFDPQTVLPRTPASLDVDVTGMAKVTADVFDPEYLKSVEASAEAAPDAPDAAAPDAATAAGAAAPDATAAAPDDTPPPPFEPTEITINKLALDAVGAKMDVTGALAVPEGGSMDAPVGKMNARLEGVNGLIDNLVKLGVVPEDQVAGARMMLAMFAKPAPEGGDVLVGEYEFKEGGQIFANGQQVK